MVLGISGTPLNEPRSGRVLVVEDNEQNRLLLRDLLTGAGFQVAEVARGDEAFRLVWEWQPDVVVLDVQLPGMSGHEVCRQLKADRNTAGIPVLMVTAQSDRETRLAGIRAGANDFITKPIDNAEFLLRARNAVQLRRLFTEIEEQYRKLEALESMRDDLVHMVAHDLRTPLTAVHANLELLKEDVAPLGKEVVDTIASAIEGAQQVTDMVSDMLEVSRMETGQFPLAPETLDMGALAAGTIGSLGARGTRITLDRPADKVIARCDAFVIGRVLTNLLDNALRYSPASAPVRVIVANEGDDISVSVHDEGPGIPPEAIDTIFEKFGQVRGEKHHRRSSGLGLTFCKLAIEAHGGRIGVASKVGRGSTFSFILPAPRLTPSRQLTADSGQQTAGN